MMLRGKKLLKELSMSKQIRLAGIINDSIVDGPGLRLSIFTQGCLLKCPGCHNEKTWDVDGGTIYNVDDIVNLWRNNPLTQGITISGGEPFLQINSILEIVKSASKDNVDTIIYTGYLYEDLVKRNDERIDEIFSLIKYLIDGPFILEKKNLLSLFRGSCNQRIIDLKETRIQNKIVLMDESNYDKK